MAGIYTSQTELPNEPALKDLLAQFRKQIFFGLNCQHMGTIKLFNPATQLAVVELAYKKTTFMPNIITGGYDATFTDYPPIIDCPVVFLGGGLSRLTFPITSGDECLLLCNDRDIDNWYTGVKGAPVATPRAHALTDAVALVGVRSLPRTIPAFDTDKATFSYGFSKVTVSATKATIEYSPTTKIEVSAASVVITTGATTITFSATGGFKVENPTASLVPAIIQLFTDVSTATAGGYPLIMPTFAADLAKLQTFTV